MPQSYLASQVIVEAVSLMRAQAFPLFTFALYFDHESEALSVCADTEENSSQTVTAINRYNAKHFHRYVAEGDIQMAKLWQANLGRSLSLGDFSMVNLARTPASGVAQSDEFFLSLVRSVIAHEATILALSPAPERVVFACSGMTDEVAFVWSADGGTHT